ncbi:MAG: sugar phosphate isomerase/epimerase [Firmicutes bacterium]|nr:sugar phosphate isomerase/epimerase [Bacillota bacterium]
MEYGAQLYTVRNFCKTEADFAKTAEKIGKIGYRWVQLSGAGPIQPKRIRRICDDSGLRIAITHTAQDRIRLETAQVIEDHRVLGADYIGVGSLPGEYGRTKEGAERFAEEFAEAIAEIGRAGMKFMYHNHDFEFEKSGGRLLLEHLADALGENAGFTLDVYWVQAGGGDPAQWLEKLAGRVDAVHFKDMTMVNGERRMAEILEGNLNWERIYAACEKAKVKWAFVEQDDCYGKNPFDCLENSLRNMEKYRKY